jgi:hypothetical protein
MPRNRIVGLAFALVLIFGAVAAQAQCGSTLSCTTSPAYTVTSSGAGNAFVGTNTNTGSTTISSGVYGSEKSAAAGSSGVLGEDASPCQPNNVNVPSAGVMGVSSGNTGVVGYTDTGAAGVQGYNMESGVCPATFSVAGYLGYKSGGNDYGVYSVGNTGATGTKNFIEPHPTDATKEIRYVSLEGPEAGTYFRGTARTVNGFATIEVPDSFRMVTAEEGLTAVVTATGQLAQIAVISKSLDKIVVQSSHDVAFDYVVNGVRRAFQNWEAVSSNQDFIPDGPNDKRFFAYPAESQRRLVATGIYNADGTVNLDKAREMGWDSLWIKQGKLAAKPAATSGPSVEEFLRFASLSR